VFFQNPSGIDLVLLNILDWILQWEDRLKPTNFERRKIFK
jgi:hypothetical protein